MRKLFAMAAFLVVSTTAQATLIHEDWKSAGDSLVTLDTTTGLEWLSMSQTALGHQEVRAKLESTYAGFRFATASELFDLLYFNVPGFPVSGFGFGSDAGLAGRLQVVMDAVGYDDGERFIDTCEHAFGCDPLGFGAGDGIHRHILSADVTTSSYAIWLNDDNDFAQVQALVRVPEPATLGMFVLGVVCVIAARTRRRMQFR